MLDERRFAAAWEAVVGRPYLPAAFARLQAAYADPERHYHNAEHIAECLREFDTVAAYIEKQSCVELAIWYHDIVYDSRATDNEDRSADWAADDLGETAAVATVRALILATKHTAGSLDGDAAWLTDIDLSILGRDGESFDRYDAAIRREYAWVPEADYRAGRRRVLRSFLDRPTIYATPEFRQRYEAAARENLARAVASL